jgi:8-oxo-dGTP diphosphatase
MQPPKVGVGVIILRGQEVLMHKRKGPHGQNTWSFPGGHLEAGESFEQAAIRETKEECGLEIESPRFVYATNDIHKEEDKHYITVFLEAKEFSNEPRVLEPQKTEMWRWVKWGEFPEPLFLPVENLLKTGYNPFK